MDGRGVAMSEREKSRPRETEGATTKPQKSEPTKPQDPFLRAENEDDDGYDPYSDRRPAPEPLFERDPWA